MGFSMNFYILQEYLVVLLVGAVMTATILVLTGGFILLQEGIRRVMPRAKTRDLPRPGLSAKDEWMRRTDARSAFHFLRIPNGLIAKGRLRFQLTR